MTTLVFAFGSNMCSGRFRDYGVTPCRPGTAAVLREHRLTFDKRSSDGSGKANVRSSPDCNVWGVLWEIPSEQLSMLDKGEIGYERRQLFVDSPSSAQSECWIYIAKDPVNDEELKPYSWYLRFLIEGAIEHTLPLEYVAGLRSLSADQDLNSQRCAKNMSLRCGQQA